MGNSQPVGPRGLHVPHVYPGPPGPHGYPPHMMRQVPARWPRPEPPIQVLPQPPPGLALRNTPNGTILQQGGTISARPQSAGPLPGRRPRSSSAHRAPGPESPDLARCGSEPDLRAQLKQQQRGDQREPRHQHQMTRGRKKYRAPPAPHPGSGIESSSPDLNGWEAAPRKARLFKTRAETNRKTVEDNQHSRLTQTLSLPRPDDKWEDQRVWSRTELREEARSRQNREELRSRQTRSVSREEVRSKRDGVLLPRVDSKEKRRTSAEEPLGLLQRSKSQDALSAKGLANPDFQLELAEAAQKIRPRVTSRSTRDSESPELPIKQVLRPSHHDLLNQEAALTKENPTPAKTFYFGMEESNKTVVAEVNTNVNKTNREHRLTAVEKSKNLMNKRQKSKEENDETLLENFAATYHRRQQHSVSGTSSMGSDPDPEEVEGIALQLRPTLPKKQLEIPRFSPTAAWRMLSSVDASPAASPDSGRGMLEERLLVAECAQLSLDKSADSGISGDASPGGGHESSSELIESPKTIHYNHQSQKSLMLAWTPEQDLEESSSEEEPPSHSKMTPVPGAKLTTRGQLFSTLPRERLEEATGDSGSLFNSLRRPTSQPSDSNWLLSRSVPGSLNGHATLVRSTSSPPASPEQLMDDPPSMTKYPSISYLAQGGHVMYLPEWSRTSMGGYSPDSSPFSNRISHNPNLSRSCEDICNDMQQPIEEPWQTNPNHAARAMTEQRPKKKKFTFQSTVRLIENKRLADKLSREAEFKETQRLSELEAMRRVEEEFQRKRAREKANIRHQLRLFSLEEKDYQSLPPMDWGRSELDAAPVSLPPVPRPSETTQVLSEYRETTRDYRDYNSRNSPAPDPHNVEALPRRNIVKHPRIVADIPKNLPVYVSAQQASLPPNPRPRDNYRKDFAHGGGRSSGDESQRPRSRLTPTRTRSSPAWDRSRSASPLPRGRRYRSSSRSPTPHRFSRREGRSISSSSSRSRSESPETTRAHSREGSYRAGNSETPESLFYKSRADSASPDTILLESREVLQGLDSILATSREVSVSPESARSREISPGGDSKNPNIQSVYIPDTSSLRRSNSPAPVREKSPEVSISPRPLVQPWSERRSASPRIIESRSIPKISIDEFTSQSLPREVRRSASHRQRVPLEDDELPRVIQTLPRESFRSASRSPVFEGSPKFGRRSRSASPKRPDSPRNNRSRSSSPPPRPERMERPVPPPRIMLSTVQPFNKAGKSYRPINFSPNVAQIVN